MSFTESQDCDTETIFLKITYTQKFYKVLSSFPVAFRRNVFRSYMYALIFHVETKAWYICEFEINMTIIILVSLSLCCRGIIRSMMMWLNTTALSNGSWNSTLWK